MKLMKSVAAGLLACCLLLSGCASSMNRSGKEDPSMQNSVQYPLDPQSFALSLLQKAAEQTSGNLVISPMSAYYALAMAAAGAQEDTLRQLELVLGGSLDDVLATCARLSEVLAAAGDDAVIEPANSIWIDPSFAVHPDFAADLSDNFHADAYAEALSTKEAMDEINRWIDTHTHGMIPHFLDQPLDANTVMALINALYFKCAWQTPFDPNKTADLDFTLDDGTVTSVPTMTLTASLNAVTLPDGGAAALLPYADTDIVFLAVLPPEGQTAAAYLSTFTPERLAACLAAEPQRVRLALPRFSMESGGELKDLLQEMGLTLPFSMDADFSAMDANGKNDLYIGSVFQKAKIEVGEKGTEAAAASMVQMLTKGARPVQAPDLELLFNRSFLFAVLDPASGMPLFSGVVASPAQ